MKRNFNLTGGYPFYIILFIFMLFSIFYFQAEILAEEERLNLTVEISPHISLEIPEDIFFTIEEPWNGGLRNIRASLYVNTNTEVELSWESTALVNRETGRSLPVGIPAQILNKLIGNERLHAEEQPFGLSTVLIDKSIYNKSDLSSYDILSSDNRGVYRSVASKNKDKLISKDRYVLEPGNYDFDILIQYYWAEDANWSQITAGMYKGEITYTVSAVE